MMQDLYSECTRFNNHVADLISISHGRGIKNLKLLMKFDFHDFRQWHVSVAIQ